MRINVTPNQVKNLLESLGRVAAGKMMLANELSEDEAKAVAGLFKRWSAGEVFTQEMVDRGVIRRFEGEIYQCNAPHTTRADWTPTAAPSLWTAKSAPGVIPVWSNPTRAKDAYPKGAKVQWPEGGKIWRSNIEANTTEPGTLPEHEYWVEVQ
jgi:hypothetical protein